MISRSSGGSPVHAPVRLPVRRTRGPARHASHPIVRVPSCSSCPSWFPVVFAVTATRPHVARPRSPARHAGSPPPMNELPGVACVPASSRRDPTFGGGQSDSATVIRDQRFDIGSPSQYDSRACGGEPNAASDRTRGRRTNGRARERPTTRFLSHAFPGRPVTAGHSACRSAVPVVLVLSRLRRYSDSYSNLIRPGDSVAPPLSWMIRNSGACHLPCPASASTSTASLSTSTILRGRSMCGAALARQRARQRRLASVTGSGRRSDCVSAARDRSRMADVLAAPIPLLEELRGRNVARSLAVGYPSGTEVELPSDPECRFKQHDSGTIGSTGDLGFLGSESRLNCVIDVPSSDRSLRRERQVLWSAGSLAGRSRRPQGISMVGIDELPKTVRDLLIADPVPRLTDARKRLLERYIGHSVSTRGFALMRTWIHQFGGSPHLPQGDRHIVCKNPECRHRGRRMKVLAAIKNDPSGGLPVAQPLDRSKGSGSDAYNYFITVYFHICGSCMSIHGESQGS